MQSLTPRSNVHRSTASALVNTSLMGTSDPPEAVTDWLARLSLLYGVPFMYLVPDYRMLPPESIRWGFLDENWIARATDGAMAIGRTNTAAASLDYTLSLVARENVAVARGQVRAQLRGATLPSDVPVGGTVAVMLIRSAVIGGYPGMEVRGLRANGESIELLRMDHLSADVLIVLFAELPATVELIEPPEGLHFGVRWNDTQTQIMTLLRSLQSATLGQQVKDGQGNAVTVNLQLRANSASNVIDMTQSAANIVTALKTYNGYTGSTLAPADMAIEMVRAAGLQRFIPGITSSSAVEARASAREQNKDAKS
jgi:hypothetical protein